jgi:hypothetical protein
MRAINIDPAYILQPFILKKSVEARGTRSCRVCRSMSGFHAPNLMSIQIPPIPFDNLMTDFDWTNGERDLE